ncbi:MAG: septum formation initiator family protein [Candidatus Rokubacteria bacterium]|nr:septum formation initiator family protein [Candidatus Rokubacteria bacterium]
MKRRALVSAGLGLVTAGLLVFGGAGLVRVWQMKQEVLAIEREIRDLRAEADRLSRTVDRLREDPALIEQIAREELGMVKGGEKVLKFPTEKR